MASNKFLRSTTTTLLVILFSIVVSITNAFVVDTDGEPLLNGGQYYIIPQNAGIWGGLALTSKNDTTPCPFYITRDRDETSPGIPVTISSPLRILYIPPSVPISIVFKDNPSICIQSYGWQVIPDESTGQSYVATGGTGNPFNPTESFSIEESDNNVYTIRYAVEGKDVGFLDKDGLLGIKKDNPLLVGFKKAFDVLAMKV